MRINTKCEHSCYLNAKNDFTFVLRLFSAPCKMKISPFHRQVSSQQDEAIIDIISMEATYSNIFEDGGTGSTCSGSAAGGKSAVAVAESTPLDIIVGSRGTHHSGPGNEKFNQIIDSYIPRYCNASTKADKGKVFLEIFKTVSSFGRFLCGDPKTGLFYELSDYSAKEKISHALRYRKKRLFKNNKRQSNVRVGGTTVSLGQLLASDRRVRSDPAQEQLQLPHISVISPRVLVQQFPQARPVDTWQSVDIISEEDMTSVLGRPGEYDWPALGLEGLVL